MYLWIFTTWLKRYCCHFPLQKRKIYLLNDNYVSALLWRWLSECGQETAHTRMHKHLCFTQYGRKEAMGKSSDGWQFIWLFFATAKSYIDELIFCPLEIKTADFYIILLFIWLNLLQVRQLHLECKKIKRRCSISCFFSIVFMILMSPNLKIH